MDIIEPFELAAQHRTLAGHLPVSSLPRLIPLLITDDLVVLGRCRVDYVLNFGVDEGGVPGLTGTLQAVLPLQCQRCMEELAFPVSLVLNLALVKSRQAAQQLPENYDPLLVLPDEETSVESIIEDELILALPQVAMHEIKDCPKGEAFLNTEDGSAPQRENPFAVLAQLKTSQSSHDD
ncbi:MAG: YceD family protein [Gammaproteobacteria bacterium]|nr:YceD family protein [Gammaproteobacteria bacterium]